MDLASDRRDNQNMDEPVTSYTKKQAALVLVYDLYRSALLNARYYGHRADATSRANRTLQIATAVCSSATLVGVIQSTWPPAALVLTAAGALVSAVFPLLGLADRAARFERLHFSYQTLYHQIDLLVGRIRSSHDFTAEGHASYELLSQLYAQLGPLDEPRPNQTLIRQLTEKVNGLIPADSLWLPQE